MNTGHQWVQLYEGSSIQKCLYCPARIRRTDDGYQHQRSSNDTYWAEGPAPLTCSGADVISTTEELEAELKVLSERIAVDPLRFQQVRDELKRRRETKDEQPPMQVTTVESQQKVDADLSRTLALKVTEMEGQQAKLVIEAEIAKAAQREAEERLALVVKRPSAGCEPMTRAAALELATKHATKYGLDKPDEHESWIIDAIIDASL